MKKFLSALIYYFIFVALNLSSAYARSDALHQTALLQSLMQGEFKGSLSVGELKKFGDTGIGTFDRVNGEMIFLDGVMYRALYNGKIEIAPDDETVPFADVTFFDADITRENVKNNLNEVLNEIVNEHGRNQFYMAKISGEFNLMHVRSELAQNEPFKRLDEALKTDQREFTYKNISGVIVALYCPEYMGSLNNFGWHMHFISEDKLTGGHVLNFEVNNCKIEMDLISEFIMNVPNDASFNNAELGINMRERIKEVEGGN